MNFYSPMSFLFLLGLIPIIIMYLLKRQYVEIEISSNFLWERAIKDIEANRPWQKLRRNLLLFLQILLFSLLVLSLTQPYIFSDMISGGEIIIVLDSSASMQSKDVDGSRFEEAKKEIREIINNIKPETYITLIAMDKNPKIIASSSNDKSILLQKLNAVKASDSKDNIEDTISLIKAMVENIDNYQILFYSDKEVTNKLDNMIVKHINGQGDNLAIENMSYTFDGSSLAVFTRVTNYSDKEYNCDLVLYADNDIFDIKEISIGKNESKNIYLYDVPSNVNILKAELDIKDSLDKDNIRYHVVNNSQINKALLVTDGNIFLEKALSLNESIELYKSNEAIEDISGYNLYIYDGLLPQTLPNDGNVIVLNPPNDSIANIIDNVKSGKLSLLHDELFKYVNLDFAIGETKVFDTPSWAEPVLLSDDSPIILRGQRDNQKYVVIGFDIHNTDFPLKIDFPIFIQNVLEYTLNLNKQENISLLSGEAINIEAMPKTTEVFVTNPNGEKILQGPPFPLTPYTDTDNIGVYTIQEKYNDKMIENYFAVNIDTTNESNIYSIPNHDDEELIKNEQRVRTGRNIKDFFLFGVILLLVTEWVVYNRGH